jgi:3-mercaptopyruvate sulfurtransferase SseA
VPGAHWVPRGWLEVRINEVAPARETPLAVTCLDGRNATLAGATLKELGYQSVAVLEGGMAAWQAAGLPVEKGLAGVMSPPNDMVLSGPDRNFADMMNYLRWEEALGARYAPAAH